MYVPVDVMSQELCMIDLSQQAAAQRRYLFKPLHTVHQNCSSGWKISWAHMALQPMQRIHSVFVAGTVRTETLNWDSKEFPRQIQQEAQIVAGFAKSLKSSPMPATKRCLLTDGQAWQGILGRSQAHLIVKIDLDLFVRWLTCRRPARMRYQGSEGYQGNIDEYKEQIDSAALWKSACYDRWKWDWSWPIYQIGVDLG